MLSEHQPDPGSVGGGLADCRLVDVEPKIRSLAHELGRAIHRKLLRTQTRIELAEEVLSLIVFVHHIVPGFATAAPCLQVWFVLLREPTRDRME